MSKKIIAFIVTVALAVGSLGFFNASAENSLEEENLKKMILLVKNKLEIGEEYTEFDYSYYESGEGNEWYFRWNDEAHTSYISVNCDDAGHIRNYSKNSSATDNIIPELTKKEVEVNVFDWIKQVEPEIADKLTLRSSYYSKYKNTYTFTYNRMENDIPMPDNSVSITITTDGKNVYGYNENWDYTVSIPKATGLMTEKEAAAIIKQNVTMELQYRLGYDEEGNQMVYLAYSPDKSYIAVNAKNGKVYFEKTYWNAGNEMFDSNENAAATDSVDKDFGATLTEAEIGKAEEIKGIITSDKAVELIKNNEYLYIGGEINSTTSRLTYSDGKYFWNITMEDIRDYNIFDEYLKNYYRAYAHATLDATTGDIISYYSNLKTEYVETPEAAQNIKIKYSKKECRNIFEEFANSVIPEKFAAVKLARSNKSYVIYADYYKNAYIYGGYDFDYDRYNENVPFYANGVNGAVDAVTGKVYEFNYNWTDAELPSTKGVIGESKAFDKYINYEGFDLVYELVNNYKDKNDKYGYSVETHSRLVYRTDITPGLVDAFTGKGLNYNGQEYVKKITTYDYKDIEGNKYERVIRLLADMGVGLAVEKFKPNQDITEGEFNELLVAAGFGGKVSPVYPVYPVYSVDKMDVEDLDVEVEEAENTADKKLTRQNAADMIIDASDLRFLADMDIFKTGYDDETKIDKDKIGAVALVKGLEILGAKKGNKFMPNAKITRGEAAQIIFNMLIAD